jgi:beta-glucosidase
MSLPLRNVRLLTVVLLLVAGAGARAADDEPTPEKKRTEIPANRDVPRHRAINERASQGNVDLIFLGDSITQGWETAGEEVWKKRYGERKAMNAGIGGDVTQHVLWRLDNGNIENLTPKLVVLMIGTNNFGGDSAPDIAAGIKAILEKLHAKLPDTKVLLLGIFPRDETPDDPLRVKNVAINDIIKGFGDGQRVHYLNINQKLMKADGVQDRDLMPDLVHLTPRAYEIWADAIEPKVAELLEGKVPHPELPKGAGKIDKEAPLKFTETATGLKYRILRKGDGAAPAATDTVTVNYKGWLDNGEKFDSSYDRGQPASFPLSAVIKGWTEGMQLVTTGGMIELEIPFQLAYGAAGRPPIIPPKATLHFLVELLDVK